MSDMQVKIGKTASLIFNQTGVEGVTMRRIANELGVTPTAIYRHFTNKEELVDVIVSEGFSILERILRKAYKQETGFSAIKKLLRSYLDFSLKYPRYFDLMFLAPRSDARRFPNDFQSRKSTAFNLLLDVVTSMMEDGKLKDDDALEVSLTIWAQTHGLATLYRGGRFGKDPARIRAILDRSTQRLVDGLTV